MFRIIKFCAFMDFLPRPLFQNVYNVVIDTISIAAQAVRQRSMEKATEEKEMTFAEEKDGLTVSGDGSWKKRGFTSFFGLVSLID